MVYTLQRQMAPTCKYESIHHTFPFVIHSEKRKTIKQHQVSHSVLSVIVQVHDIPKTGHKVSCTYFLPCFYKCSCLGTLYIFIFVHIVSGLRARMMQQLSELASSSW